MAVSSVTGETNASQVSPDNRFDEALALDTVSLKDAQPPLIAWPGSAVHAMEKPRYVLLGDLETMPPDASGAVAARHGYGYDVSNDVTYHGRGGHRIEHGYQNRYAIGLDTAADGLLGGSSSARPEDGGVADTWRAFLDFTSEERSLTEIKSGRPGLNEVSRSLTGYAVSLSSFVGEVGGKDADISGAFLSTTAYLDVAKLSDVSALGATASNGFYGLAARKGVALYPVEIAMDAQAGFDTGTGHALNLYGKLRGTTGLGLEGGAVLAWDDRTGTLELELGASYALIAGLGFDVALSYENGALAGSAEALSQLFEGTGVDQTDMAPTDMAPTDMALTDVAPEGDGMTLMP